MDVPGMYVDSLKYPLKDANKLLFLGAVFIVGGLLTILPVMFGAVLSIDNVSNLFLLAKMTFVAMGIISFLILAIISGYGISIIRKTLFNPDQVPTFDVVKNLVNGLKLAVVSIVYYSIPLAISLVVSYFTGSLNYLLNVISFPFQVLFNSNVMFTSYVVTSGTGLSLVFMIWFLLSALSTLLLIIAVSRLAETDSLIEAFKIEEVFNDLSKIGIINYVIWIVLYLVIGIVLSILSFTFMFIPFIGIIIVYLVFMPFIVFFSARAIGLLYNESKLILNH